MRKRRRILQALGETELEVLQIVWSLGSATVGDVLEIATQNREVAYTTVMTVLKKLADKGYLTRDDSKTSYVYTAARRPEDVKHSMLKDVLEKVFQGSATALVQTLVKREQLSDEERAHLLNLLNEMEGEDEHND